ncbi:uncharacterized protein LOC141720172 [Apium graveolens]|uniref:uncharacterized protein LOC141720172 n=1 Tax=Apium graveolens TaxID=4045 RepID=UPI003D793421
MSLLSWNCRELANPRTVRFLNEINSQYRPSILFLSETLVKKNKVERVSKKLGFAKFFAVDAQGHGGGLAPFWKNEEGINILSSCNNFIDFECNHETLGKWRYTGYYGFPERSRRVDSWNMIRNLSASSTLPWCIIVDFNDMMSGEEKRGGQRQPRALLDDFSETIMDCGLEDLGYTGDIYTWERARGMDRWIQERLDRGLATKEWCELFPAAEVQVLEMSSSDHMPLVLQLHKQVYIRKRCRFKFENMWVKESECRSIVQSCWNEEGVTDLLEKMVRCCAKLEEWGGGLIRDMKLKIEKYKNDMKRLRARRDVAGIRQYEEARWQYMRLLEKKEIFWRQRAKQYWLREGDKNTRFFHKYASMRKEYNKIKRLKYENGEWKETEEEIQGLITEYFVNIFSTSNMEERLSNRIGFKQVDEEQKQALMLPINDEEVRTAVFAMHPDKAPGLDGLNPSFFQAYWTIVGPDVCKFCQHFFDTGVLPASINIIVVCLIPKVKHPQKVVDLRPIPLCNVLMRILSKVMANRVKPVLPTIISEQQSAFIENRLLTDNAFVAFEVNHYIPRKTQGSVGVAGLKVDVSKAYDRLEWQFIEFMQQKFDFPQLWIDRIMKCVKTVTYSFLHDGKIFGSVIPQRGVRQGDPISPYLYIMCAEGLSGILRRYEEVGLLHGCKIARGAPSISHMLFTDDCYFIFRASRVEASIMKDILQQYQNVSGQMINSSKSNITFSPNTAREDRAGVCEVLRIQETDAPGKYLGMPMRMGRNKMEVLGFLKDKVQQKLQGWANKDISKHGKLTLLSSATQVLPSFWMNVFLIPIGICEDIERKMNGFLWGRGVTGKGVRWMSWARMCRPKGCGGLGVKDLRKFNLAMLAKQGWRLVQQSNVLVSSIIKARYYPNTSFLEAGVGRNPSYVWRSLMEAIGVVKAGTRRKIGNGMDTKVWHIPWLPAVDLGYLTTEMPDKLKDITVNSLMDDTGKNWDIELVEDIFNTRDADLIKRVPIPMSEKEDSWFWLLDESGMFTVKSAYRWLQGEYDNTYKSFCNKLWSLKFPGKVMHFLWRVCTGCLPTACALSSKQIVQSVQCPWCRSGIETDTHVLFTCNFARTVWNMTGVQQVLRLLPQEPAFRNLLESFATATREQCVQVGMIAWALWSRRNKWVWEHVNGSAFGVKATATRFITEWR